MKLQLNLQWKITFSYITKCSICVQASHPKGLKNEGGKIRPGVTSLVHETWQQQGSNAICELFSFTLAPNRVAHSCWSYRAINTLTHALYF